MAVVAHPSPFGALLREWRERRNLSQLRLASGSAVSARHLSFIETGRAQPSREMVLHLAERLEIPLRDRNRLLLAAGYAPAFVERSLDDANMAPVSEALGRFLAAHEPYPALVLDRHRNLVLANRAVGLLTAGAAPELLERPVNFLRLALHPKGLAPQIVNFQNWSCHLMRRLRREIDLTADERLQDLYTELAGYPRVCTGRHGDIVGADDIAVPLRLRRDGGELAFFSTRSVFGTALDVTLAELVIEAHYPADDETAAALMDYSGSQPADALRER
jgi:transcriptional regulator with XRE-family HTH domain